MLHATGLFIVVVLAWARWWPMRPLFDVPHSTVLIDRHGQLLGATVADDGQWRMPAIEQVPEQFEQCLLTFEDRHFREHFGIHPPSLVRAMVQNQRTGRRVSGGSTLTMQLARMARGNRPRTYWNKLIELLDALRLEIRCSKDEILRSYVSNAPFGGNVVGAEAAAWRWFGRPLETLSWGEHALLAVLPNSPARMHPGKNRDALRDKRDRLLQRLLDDGHIDSLRWSLALEEPLPEAPMAMPHHAPHLLATLQLTGYEGQRIRTTIDAELQLRASTIMDRHGNSLRANEVHNAAVLIMDVPTGAVLAYVGNLPSASAAHAGHVDIVRAPRSTGSLLKPMLYADMLQSGERTPRQLVADVPTRYDGFVPENFDRTYSGAVPADVALARSLNIPAVRALREHGVERTLATLRSMGLAHIDRSADNYGLSLVVGGAESTLWELTGAYASMARILQATPADTLGPLVHEPYVIADRPIAGPYRTPPLRPAALYHMMDAIRTLNRPESEIGWEHFNSAGAIAWKTGTSFGHRDAWAIGVTPRYAIGIWTGNASGEGRPGLTGSLAAAPLLFELFHVLPGSAPFDPPFDQLDPMAICRSSGHRASPDCDVVDTLWTIKEAERTPPCPYHVSILTDATGRQRVPAGPDAVRRSWFVLPPAMEVYHAQRQTGHQPLPSWGDGPGTDPDDQVMEMLYPERHARIIVPRTLAGTYAQVVLHAAHRDPGAMVHWDLDGLHVGTTVRDHRMAMDLGAGTHVVTLTDAHGKRSAVPFSVQRSVAER
jgi:penicillin-binding protein 1C